MLLQKFEKTEKIQISWNLPGRNLLELFKQSFNNKLSNLYGCSPKLHRLEVRCQLKPPLTMIPF